MDGHDAMVETHGEEAVSARVAPVGRKVQQAEQPDKGALGDVLPGDPLQIEIAAKVAVGIFLISQGHNPGIKPQFATSAAPRTQCGQADEIVAQIPPFGTPAMVAVAPRTKQRCTTPGRPLRGKAYVKNWRGGKPLDPVMTRRGDCAVMPPVRPQQPCQTIASV